MGSTNWHGRLTVDFSYVWRSSDTLRSFDSEPLAQDRNKKRIAAVILAANATTLDDNTAAGERQGLVLSNLSIAGIAAFLVRLLVHGLGRLGAWWYHG
jgi:hypothetical protein